MAGSLNVVHLIGNVGKDPITRQMQNGKSVTSFSVATSETYGTGDNKKTQTEWHACSAFSPISEVVQKYVSKGKQIYVQGSIRTNNWTDKQGNKQSTKQIVVRSLQLLGKRDAEKQAQSVETTTVYEPTFDEPDVVIDPRDETPF